MEELIKFLNEAKSKKRKIDELGRITIPVEYRSATSDEIVYQIIEGCLVISYSAMDNWSSEKLDRLGRMEISEVLRERLGWKENDIIEIINFKEYIILRKKN